MHPKDDLSDLLQSWRPDIETGSGFNRGVWSRIEVSQAPSSFTEFLFGLFALFSSSRWIQSMGNPRIAIAAAAIALFGGVLIGGVQARSLQEERYLVSLKPLAAHR